MKKMIRFVCAVAMVAGLSLATGCCGDNCKGSCCAKGNATCPSDCSSSCCSSDKKCPAGCTKECCAA